MKARVYLETTVVSYLAARSSRDIVLLAHQQITREWWENQRSRYELFVSQAVIDEAGGGNAEAAQRRLQLLGPIQLLDLTEQVQGFARELIGRGAVPRNAVLDAVHIAVATVHGMEYLLTWNCRHIANAAGRSKMMAASRAMRWELPIICTPEELLEGD